MGWKDEKDKRNEIERNNNLPHGTFLIQISDKGRVPYDTQGLGDVEGYKRVQRQGSDGK